MGAFKKIADVELPQDLKSLPPMDAFCSIWPMIKPILEFVKIFTGSRADAKIDQVIDWGDGVCALNSLGDQGSQN